MRINKYIFVWIGTFLVGRLGVWTTVDWIIAMVKVYGGAMNNQEELAFIDERYIV